jgi:hypothetical protein
VADTRQVRENQVFVRRLLRERQPDFAAALELAVRNRCGGRGGYRQPGHISPGATACGIAGFAAARPSRSQFTPNRETHSANCPLRWSVLSVMTSFAQKCARCARRLEERIRLWQ